MAKKSKHLYAFALGLFLLGVGYLVVSGISENSVYFLNVAEVLELPPAEVRAARLFGTVKDTGDLTLPDGKGVAFELMDIENRQKTLRVVYTGLVPENFKPGAEVIVEGSFSSNHEQFDAKTLMTKCPSKYQKENRV